MQQYQYFDGGDESVDGLVVLEEPVDNLARVAERLGSGEWHDYCKPLREFAEETRRGVVRPTGRFLDPSEVDSLETRLAGGLARRTASE